jgi:outer membrane protein assembly factor BamB
VDVATGAVIFARAALASTGSGASGSGDPREVAYVGNHAGRFVGVVVTGADAGTLALDVTLGGMIWSTAVLADGRAYVGADDDQLVALSLTTGKIEWARKLGSCEASRAPGPEGARCDVDGGPTLGADGELYVGADGLYRVRTDGTVVWRFPAEGEAAHVFSTPLVGSGGGDGGRVVFGTQEGRVVALTRAGDLAWSVAVEGDADGSAVALADGTVVIGADDGKVRALAPDGTLRWAFVTHGDVRSAVVLARDEGTIYVTSFDGVLYALAPDGALRWMLPTAGRLMASPAVDGAGNVVFAGQDHHVVAVDPGGRVLWSVALPGDVDSTPVITPSGAVVVGCDDGHLRALR